MLYLIGLGLNDEKDLTLKGVETAKQCECFVELYTSHWKGSVSNLEKIIGKQVIQLKRKDMEENLEELIKKAKEKDIAIFVPGDPLAATTHIELLILAKRMRIPFRIIHNASIFSAVGESGLQLYKFGKTASIPFTEQIENVKETVAKNKKIGLHTLLLLDIDSEVELFMNVGNALKILLKNKVIKNTDRIIVLSRLGDEKPEIIYETVRWLIDRKFDTPSALIIPGKFHFKEKEYLEIL